jgi:hypothetical protein
MAHGPRTGTHFARDLHRRRTTLAHDATMRSLRASVLVIAVTCGALVFGTSTSFAATPRAKDPCPAFEAIRTQVQGLESASTFDADGYKKVGKAFRKQAKKAPKEIRKAMKKVAKFYLAVAKSDSETEASDVYSTQLEKYRDEIQGLSDWLGANCNGTSDSGGSTAAGSGKGGTLTLAGETISLDTSRCYLQSQTAAGQKILWNGQATGTNAAGEDVLIDVSRYDASSQFAGDDVSIDVGPLGNSVSWSGRYDAGTVDLSGKTLSASDIEVRNDEFETATASFEINC